MSKLEDSALTRRPEPADLTIAICTIGRDGYLQAAIQSLLDTTPPGVSLHVVLNGPDDPTLGASLGDLLAQWAGPVEITELSERLTISASHNTALDATTTDFVTFMGDDDLALEPRVEELLTKFWNTTPTPAVVGSFCRRVSGTGDAPRFSTNKDYGPASIEEWEHLRSTGDLIEIVFPSAIYRTQLLKEIGGFEDRFGSAMDLATFTILARNHPVLADPRRSFAHRIHDGSVTSSAAGQHAQRLRYTELCMKAGRESQVEPDWDDFVRDEQLESTRLQSLLVGRDVTGAALFRAGGAALASGDLLPGIAKIAKAAVVSPKALQTRLQSQVASNSSSEPVVVIVADDWVLDHTALLDALRVELRHRSIELRVVLDASNPAGMSRSAPHWIESPPVWELNAAGKSHMMTAIVDFGPKPELTIVAAHTKAQRTWSGAAVSLREPRPFALWVGESDLPIEDSTPSAIWLFAEDEASVRVGKDLGLASAQITALFEQPDVASQAQLFAEGVAAALRRSL